METNKELKILGWIVLAFAVAFFLPVTSPVFRTAVDATLDLTKWYAREHVVMCLLPAFFIAGVIMMVGFLLIIYPLVINQLLCYSKRNSTEKIDTSHQTAVSFQNK